tara:strand:- start:430 stop:726 length:297 start_codon:yes stop_codon:yes gene_type:complete
MCLGQAYQNTRDALQENVIDPWKANPIGGALGMATGLGPVTAGLMIKRRKKEKAVTTADTAQDTGTDTTQKSRGGGVNIYIGGKKASTSGGQKTSYYT